MNISWQIKTSTDYVQARIQVEYMKSQGSMGSTLPLFRQVSVWRLSPKTDYSDKFLALFFNALGKMSNRPQPQ